MTTTNKTHSQFSLPQMVPNTRLEKRRRVVTSGSGDAMKDLGSKGKGRLLLWLQCQSAIDGRFAVLVVVAVVGR